MMLVMEKGDVFRCRGYRPFMPKLGSWSIDAVCVIEEFDKKEGMMVRCVWSNTQKFMGKKFAFQKSKWTWMRRLSEDEMKRWKLLLSV